MVDEIASADGRDGYRFGSQIEVIIYFELSFRQ